MAIITTPPVLIDPTDFSRQSTNTRNPFGAKYGNKLYLVQQNNNTPAIGVFKSADFGATWAEMDAASKPLGAPVMMFDDHANNKLCILYVRTVFGTPNYRVVEFDVTNDTYGTPSNAFVDTSFGAYQMQGFYRKTSGEFVLIENNGSQLREAHYSGGAWIGPTNIFLSGTSFTLYNGSRDGSDNFFMGGLRGTLPGVAFYGWLDSSYAFNGFFDITTFSSSTVWMSQVILDGTDLLGVASGVGGTPPPITAFRVADPTGVKTVTTYPIANPNSLIADYLYTTLGGTGSWEVWFIETDRPAVDAIYQAHFNGAGFDAPFVFFDAITNPPPDEDPNDFIHTLQTFEISPGVWVAATAMETIDSGVNHCTGFFLVQGGSRPRWLPQYVKPLRLRA